MYVFVTWAEKLSREKVCTIWEAGVTRMYMYFTRYQNG